MSGEVREQTDLASWLLACIEEDEVSAKAVTPLRRNFDMDGNRQDEVFTHNRLMFASKDGRSRPATSGEERQHFERWEPARVLAECDTKRRIIEMFPTSAPKTDGEGNFEGFTARDCGEHRTVGGRAWCHDCGEWCYPDAPCVRCHGVSDVLRLLALPYRDRDGYRAEWSPDGR